MATIHVDGKEYEVDGADNLLEACLSLGLDVPYFCWHPALGSVGACRQCAVKQYQNADDKRGRLVMSCMTPASDGTYISIDDEEAKAFRENVVEWMMTNHPHDCPVCEEGGACHLQDMTVMTGHHTRRYRFTKRTHKNQELGPFIAHEMNRCIACYRCVRYYKEYADGQDLGVFGAHDNVYFGRTEDGTLESEFSGNLVEVCPTGVFTDKTHSVRFNRKWDMQYAPSVCHQCALGCNISPGERYGELRRIENRFNGAVNHYFLCDRGRFGYGYVNDKQRPRQPWRTQGESRDYLGAEEAITLCADSLRQLKGIIGIGSPRASLESNFALRELVGEENFYSGIGIREWGVLHRMVHVMQSSRIPIATLREVEEHDAVLILGEDITQTAARLALSVRQALKGKARQMAEALKIDRWQAAAIKTVGQGQRHPLLITSLDASRLDDVATDRFFAASEDQARLGFAIAHELDPDAPAVTGLSEQEQAQARRWAEYLRSSKRPLIIAGTQAGSLALIDAATNIGLALDKAKLSPSFFFVAHEVNSIGSVLLGGQPLDSAFSRLEQEPGLGLIVLENDLSRRTLAPQMQSALAKVEQLIVLDHRSSDLLARADFVFPAASFAEGDGTVVSTEGRAQRFYQVFAPEYYDESILIKESWRWLDALGQVISHRRFNWRSLDQITTSCAMTIESLKPIVDAAPNARFRIKGMKIARSPHRYSGRTAMLADQDEHEPGIPKDSDSPFTFSMEGYSGSNQPFQQVPFAWAPGWNSPSAWNKFQDEVGGHLRAGDPGLRLFEPVTDLALGYFSQIPEPYQRVENKLSVVGYCHLFGSEELSQLSTIFQQRMVSPVITLSVADCDRYGFSSSSQLCFSYGDVSWQLPFRVSEQLPAGLIGLPLGMAGLPLALLHVQPDSLDEVTS